MPPLNVLTARPRQFTNSYMPDDCLHQPLALYVRRKCHMSQMTCGLLMRRTWSIGSKPNHSDSGADSGGIQPKRWSNFLVKLWDNHENSGKRSRTSSIDSTYLNNLTYLTTRCCQCNKASIKVTSSMLLIRKLSGSASTSL